MPVEIEKKYRLTRKQREAVLGRLRRLNASPGELEFEENTLYRGGRLDLGGCALRLRRVNGRTLLTFKQRFPTKSAIKHQREEETEVANGDVLATILRSLEFRPAVVYEKRRTRWQLGKAEIAMDELPFGLFMEIEASEKEIGRVESLLEAGSLPAVMETYPTLTAQLGQKRGGVIEARFARSVRERARRSNSK
ncbi:MAG: adenylate cyclase, class 2 [Blastocatellia bacterium]|jgi:predicted adenylyl cyclase CyaB|nr:adenylate cyclase, class 2 [Blastocatellia bacterium]